MKYFKRTSFAIGCVFLVFLMYLTFFNHPPAGDTLASNLENTNGEGAPRFHHLRLRGGGPDGGGETGRKTRSSEKHSREISPRVNKNVELRNQTSGERFDEVGAKRASREAEGGINEGGTGSGAINEPVERAGKNGNITGAMNVGSDAVNKLGNAFDWDAWVKDNGYVDIGTVWAYCDEPNPATIGKITLQKDNQNGGVKYNVDYNSTILEQIDSGKIVFNVELNGVHFATRNYEICDAAVKWEWDAFICPIKKGNLVFHYEKHVPGYMPSGEYYGECTTTDQSEKVVLCGQFTLKL